MGLFVIEYWSEVTEDWRTWQTFSDHALAVDQFNRLNGTTAILWRLVQHAVQQ